MADIFDDIEAQALKLRDSARSGLKSLSTLASQTADTLKATPGNAGAVSDALKSVAPDAARPITRWDVESGLRDAKARLLGIWRGYVVPAFRQATQ
jgi:hypothetical protein